MSYTCDHGSKRRWCDDNRRYALITMHSLDFSDKGHAIKELVVWWVPQDTHSFPSQKDIPVKKFSRYQYFSLVNLVLLVWFVGQTVTIGITAVFMFLSYVESTIGGSTSRMIADLNWIANIMKEIIKMTTFNFFLISIFPNSSCKRYLKFMALKQ